MGRKKKQYDYVQCMKCKSVFCKELLDSHHQQCLIIDNEDNHIGASRNTINASPHDFNHNFLKDKILHCSIQKFTSDFKPKGDTDTCVFIHPTTLEVCSIGKGQFVVVLGSQYRTLHIAYPCTTVKKLQIAFQHQNSNNHKLNDYVKVFAYSQHVPLAKKLVITATYDDKIYSVMSFKRYVLYTLKEQYISVGTTYQDHSKGRHYEFKITDIHFELPEFFMPNSSKQETSFHDSVDSSHRHTFTKVRYFSFSTNEDVVNSEIEFFVVDMSTVIEITVPVTEHPKVQVPTPNNVIGGLKPQLSKLKEYLDHFLQAGTSFNHGILLYGPSGTGKSLVANTIANQDVIFTKLTPSQVFRKDFIEGKNLLKAVFEIAVQRSPSVILIEDLDELCELFRILDNSKIYNLVEEIDKAKEKGKVFLIATAKDLSLINDNLQSVNKFDINIQFTLPDIHERKEILQNILAQKSCILTNEQISDLADCTHAFSGCDISKACTEAELLSLHEQRLEACSEYNQTARPIVSFCDIKHQMKKMKPASLRNNNYKVEKVFWNDVAGMHAVKEKFKQIVELPLKHPDVFHKFKVTPARGLLLYGPPGCSKTMIAKALANETAANFIPIKGSELFSKWFGESERAIRDLFKKAKEAAPCIIFFDEIDTLITERESSGGSEVGNRVVAQFLAEVGGSQQLDGVFIVAATNRPDMLDPAMLRPGRINHLIYVPLPDAETRREIFSLKLKTMPTEDVDLDLLVEKTEGYSGAEVVCVCHEAALVNLAEHFPHAPESPIINRKHFETALQRVQPKTQKETIAFYENFQNCCRTE